MIVANGPVSVTQSVALVTDHSTATVMSVYQTPHGANSTHANAWKTGQVMTVAHGEVTASIPVTPVTEMKHVTVMSVLSMLTMMNSITEPVSVTTTGSMMDVSTGWEHVTQSVMDVLVQIAVIVSTVYITLTRPPTISPSKPTVNVTTGGQETTAQSTRDGVTTNVTVAGDLVPVTVTNVLSTLTSTTTDTVSVTKTGLMNAVASTSEIVIATVNKNMDASAQEKTSVLNVP